MQLEIFLATLTALVSFAYGSCDLGFCVSQFCPPSVGDVGYCLCNSPGSLYEVEANQCFISECHDENNEEALNSLVGSCCRTFLLYYSDEQRLILLHIPTTRF